MSLGNSDVDGCMERTYNVRISFLMLMLIEKYPYQETLNNQKRQAYNPMTINMWS